ncbi:hypothetical protein EJB05_37877, partial [Eragrostis curvula]
MKEKRVTMQQKSEEVESTGSQCNISVKKEMQRAAEEELKEVAAAVESNCDEIERMNNHYLAGRRRMEKQTKAANARLKELLKLRHRKNLRNFEA